MPNLEYDVPMRLETPGGTVFLNDPDPATGDVFRVRFDGYQIIPAMRVTQDNISQADGSVLHTRYKTGLVATMTVTYFTTVSGTDANSVTVSPACGLQLQSMHQQLVRALNSIQALSQAPGAVQRYFWTPTDYGDERLLDDVQILAWPNPTYDLDGIEKSVTFSIESPFPYAIDSMEIDTEIAGSASALVTNTGNSDQSPVVKVYGPLTEFVLTNYDDLDDDGNAKAIVYDSSRPGAAVVAAGHYAEIDFFRGTIFLDGDSTDLIAGIDPTTSDFWVLKEGTANLIGISGAASATILSNNAWA